MTGNRRISHGARALDRVSRFGGRLRASRELSWRPVDGDFFVLVGTTTIERLPSQPAGEVTFYCEGSPTFTHSAHLTVPGASDYTASAGDVLRLLSLGSGVWVLATLPYDGSVPAAPAGAADGLFNKTDWQSVGFTRTGLGTVAIKAGTKIELNGTVYSYDADTAVQMPTHSVGAYFIYQCNDGSIRGDASAIAPVGFDATTSRQIGGYYYGPGGLATGYNTGGDTTPQILIPTIWDLKFRPSVHDRRGWSFTGSGWVSLWPLGVNWIVDGVSAHGATIADGVSPPKIPLSRGGDGTAAYGSLTQWEADEVYRSAGARLLDPLEFAAAVFGVVEGTSCGSDPVTTQLDAPRTSMYMYQAAGNMWVWGRDFSTRWDGTGGWAWRSNTGGRGQLHIGGDVNFVAALLGGAWHAAADAGSRAAAWHFCPWNSNSSVGARGYCDHVCHI